MARGNTYKCLCCGKEYEYCPKCAVVKPTYDIENFCCKAHEQIFKILSKHGCGNATAEETLDALKPYDTANLKESVQAHIESLQPVGAKKKKAVKETVQE